VGQLADLRQRHRGGALGALMLHALSTAELLSRYAGGELSPVDVARDLIAHVERWEPVLHALWAFEPERVLAQARESEARWRAGTPRTLDGVPCTIKENIATRGLPVPLGTAATQLTPAAADAPPAARLKEAGAVLIAKTTMPDWGMLSSGLSSFHQLARNPWDPATNPGGSSAGAGAAAAAGYGPLHLGTDIGGSVRLPAAWCGVVGLKPSGGRIPIHPPYAGRVAGPMTRAVDDAARLMAVLSLPDARDTMSLPYQSIDWAAPALEPKGLRLGLWLDAGWGLPVEPEILAAVQAAARRFEAAGASVEPVAPFTTREMGDGMDRFWRMRSWLDFQALPPQRQDKVLPYIRQWIARGADLSAADVFHGYSQMGALREAAVAATAPFDFLLSPVAPVSRFPAEWAGPTNDPATAMDHIAFTVPFNMSEQPALSIDCGRSAAGAPIGLQIIGHRHDDLGVLRAARLWEQLRDTLPPAPPLQS
jgi:Asp-tRNA(Asn)/Glu-tRNA(Gln) amidotransferase A subunit family amidase